jgi:branched-chain amino acid transport system permease protein
MNWDTVAKYKRQMIWGAIGLLLLALPWILTNPYYQSIMTFIGIYGLAATGLGLLTGYTGQVSLGQSAFYALGAYISTLVTVNLKVSPWLGLLCGAALTGIIAYILGKPFLRIRGFYLALVTLTFSLLLFHLISRMDFITGGYDGITGIPRFSIGSFVLNKDYHYYYLLLILIAAAIIFDNNLIKSKIGRRMRAADLFTGGSEAAAKSIGVDIGKLKTQVFIVCCVYAAIAGSVFAHYMGHINPEPFSANASILFLIMIVVGGQRSIWGGLIGATFYVLIKELLSHFTKGTIGWDLLVYALIFLAILTFLPQGLASFPSRISALLHKIRHNKGIG